MKGNLFITGVAISTVTNKPAIFHSAPVPNAQGQVVGVVRSRASLDKVIQVVAAPPLDQTPRAAGGLPFSGQKNA